MVEKKDHMPFFPFSFFRYHPGMRCSLKPREFLLTTQPEGERSGGAVGVGIGLCEGMREKESGREAIGFRQVPRMSSTASIRSNAFRVRESKI